MLTCIWPPKCHWKNLVKWTLKMPCCTPKCKWDAMSKTRHRGKRSECRSPRRFLGVQSCLWLLLSQGLEAHSSLQIDVSPLRFPEIQQIKVAEIMCDVYIYVCVCAKLDWTRDQEIKLPKACLKWVGPRLGPNMCRFRLPKLRVNSTKTLGVMRQLYHDIIGASSSSISIKIPNILYI